MFGQLDAAHFAAACDPAITLDVAPKLRAFGGNAFAHAENTLRLHGSAFDLRTGKPSGLPATRPVPVYPVKIEGDDAAATVLVSLTQES